MTKDSHILLFGLTADPFHLGHAAYIEACKDKYPKHLIVIMPCKANPLGKCDEQGKKIYPTSGEIRYAMLKELFNNDSRVFVSRYEIDNPNPSYTIDTINYLRHMHIDDLIHDDVVWTKQKNIVSDITLMIGSDNFLQLPHWHRWQDIVRQTNIIIMQRPGYLEFLSYVTNKALKEALIMHYSDDEHVGSIHVWKGPQHLISSTEIKRLIREGANDELLRSFLPESILQYIRKNITELSSSYRQ